MNRQQQIDLFLLDAHRLALARLRAQPERLRDVAALLARWREQAGPTRSDPYWDEWTGLLQEGVEAIEREACGTGDHAAALRSVSPLSVLINQQERSAMLDKARHTG
ncbi:MAG TPA: hypothetical protein VLJ57_15650 [Burkholderiaceae bacterium]|nr:hypothetical protein [Burkholderiaceae bacterium]